jgi:hypothetical protein
LVNGADNNPITDYQSPITTQKTITIPEKVFIGKTGSVPVFFVRNCQYPVEIFLQIGGGVQITDRYR